MKTETHEVEKLRSCEVAIPIFLSSHLLIFVIFATS
jgi:hypothetical protein